jgi:Tim17/Tim22/Tim23/Pmp24 family
MLDSLVCSISARSFLVLTAFFVWDAAAMGATFALTETVVANQRQKNDPLNGVAGGCAAGFLAGIRGALILLYQS